MSAKLGSIVVLALLAGLFCFAGTAYSDHADYYYTCTEPDGTVFESATNCDYYYYNDYGFPGYNYFEFDRGGH